MINHARCDCDESRCDLGGATLKKRAAEAVQTSAMISLKIDCDLRTENVGVDTALFYVLRSELNAMKPKFG